MGPINIPDDFFEWLGYFAIIGVVCVVTGLGFAAYYVISHLRWM